MPRRVDPARQDRRDGVRRPLVHGRRVLVPRPVARQPSERRIADRVDLAAPSHQGTCRHLVEDEYDDGHARPDTDVCRRRLLRQRGGAVDEPHEPGERQDDRVGEEEARSTRPRVEEHASEREQPPRASA